MARGKYKEWITKDGLLKLEGWARDGLTDEQIAHNIGIGTTTLYRWKNDYPEIREALKNGKEVIDIMVENALLKRALGYQYIETTKERIIDTGQRKRHSGDADLNQSEWEMCLAYFKASCAYCGDSSSNMTMDHLDPLKNGGLFTVKNIIPACQKCNSSKKDNQWLAWYQKQPFYDKKKAEKIVEYINFVMILPDKTQSDDLVVTKEVTKEVQPDTTAQIFWLKNRRPDKWRDRKDLELSGEVNNPFEGLTTTDLKKLIKDE